MVAYTACDFTVTHSLSIARWWSHVLSHSRLSQKFNSSLKWKKINTFNRWNNILMKRTKRHKILLTYWMFLFAFKVIGTCPLIECSVKTFLFLRCVIYVAYVVITYYYDYKSMFLTMAFYRVTTERTATSQPSGRCLAPLTTSGVCCLTSRSTPSSSSMTTRSPG